jgi:hypothetical protein
MSDDRLMWFLQYLVILLFLSAGLLPLVRGRQPWAKWARWGAIAAFCATLAYALFLVLRWALGLP